MPRIEQLPLSGKTVSLRGMTGHEEDLLTDKKLVKKGKVMDNIISACVLELDGEKPANQDIAELTTADRTFLLVKIREESYGTTIEDAEVKCTSKDCNKKSYFDIDLSTLPVTESETRDEDEEFDFILPASGAKGRFRHLKGTDEAKLIKFGEEEILTIGILIRLTEVVQADAKEKEHPNGYKKWLKSLPVRDRAHLRKVMEETEVGVKTDLTLECDHCGSELKVRVESLQSFFFPGM